MTIFLTLSISCTSNNDSLDQIKDFQPDNEYFKASLVSLHFLIEVSPIEKVDTVFMQLIDIHHLPVDAKGTTDGIYIGESPNDAFDYRHEVSLKIKDGKIVELDYNEINKKGIGKQEDQEYNEEMSVTGTSPAIAYPIYENKLLRTQNILDVDGVSGASYSLYRFRFAVTIALMKASL